MSNFNAPANSFPVENEFYKLASFTGRPRKFETPEDLLYAANDYFEWCENNPIIVEGVYGADARVIGVPKMRAMSLQGLCSYIGVCNLRHYKKVADFSHIMGYINTVIYDYNLTGALVGLLNPCIMARVLGLRERIVNKNVLAEVVVYQTDSLHKKQKTPTI